MSITLGQPVPEFAKRDAIHVAVVPVVASEDLEPGRRVGLIPGTLRAYRPVEEIGIGIVDPFLRSPVVAGQRFWLLLDPGTATNLRHEWEHPGIDSVEGDEDESVRCYKDC